jgi:hypothetical protein
MIARLPKTGFYYPLFVYTRRWRRVFVFLISQNKGEIKMFPKQQLKFIGKRPRLLGREPSSNNITDRKKELEEIASKTLTKVIDSVDDKLELEKLDSFQKRQFTEQIYDTLIEVLEESSLQLSQSDKQKVIQYVTDEIFGYGPINSLLEDPAVTEIMVNGYDNVYVERDGRITKTEVTFRNNEHVLHVINKIITPLGRRIDESSPTVDARLPDGSRVNAIIPPLALKGPSLTIRKFAADPFTVEDVFVNRKFPHILIENSPTTSQKNTFIPVLPTIFWFFLSDKSFRSYLQYRIYE